MSLLVPFCSPWKIAICISQRHNEKESCMFFSGALRHSEGSLLSQNTALS